MDDVGSALGATAEGGGDDVAGSPQRVKYGCADSRRANVPSPLTMHYADAEL